MAGPKGSLNKTQSPMESTIDILEYINKNLVGDMLITSKHDLSVARSVLSGVNREFAYALCTTIKERTDFLEIVGPAPRFTEKDHNHICTVCNTKGWCEDDPVAKELKAERIDELEMKLKELKA